MEEAKTINKVAKEDFVYDVFISYSFSDGIAVSVICDYLEKRGLRCFVAERDMPKGAHFSSIIPMALDHSRIMLVAMSQQCDLSLHTSREIIIAAESGIPIILVKLENCAFTREKKYYLSDVNWIDATEGVAAKMPEIEKACRGMLGNLPPRKTFNTQVRSIKKPWYRRNPMMTNVSILLLLILCLGFTLFLLKTDKPVTELAATIIPPMDTIPQNKVVEDLATDDGLNSMAIFKEKTERKNSELRYRRQRVRILEEELTRSLQNDGTRDGKKIDSLMLELVNESKKATANKEKMMLLEPAIKRVPTTCQYMEPRTKEVITEEIINLANSEGTDKDRVNFYMGILYYYGIASFNYQSNPRQANDCFAKSSKPIASFYQALCLLKMAENISFINEGTTSDIIDKLHRAKMFVEKDETKYLYGTLSSDANYFLDRLDNTSYDRKSTAYKKEMEAYYLIDTRKMYTEESVRKLFEDFFNKKVKGKEGRADKSYTDDDLKIIQMATQLNDSVAAYAYNELAWEMARIGEYNTALAYLDKAKTIVGKYSEYQVKKLRKIIEDNIKNIDSRRRKR